MEKICDEDSLVAINKPKTVFLWRKVNETYETYEILKDNNEMFIDIDKKMTMKLILYFRILTISFHWY